MLDKKFSVFRKEEQYVVCSGGEIVWLVNERTDNRYRVTTETRRILLLHVDFATKDGTCIKRCKKRSCRCFTLSELYLLWICLIKYLRNYERINCKNQRND